jgi:hypothetical protein
MTRQKRKTEKARYHLKLEVKNYDFLCVQALRQGVSMAALLNQLLETARIRGTAICKPIYQEGKVTPDGNRRYLA